MKKKIRYKLKKLFYVLSVMAVLISNCNFSYSHASELSFSVNPITPSVQRQGSKNKYFDVLMAPGEYADLKVNLKNTTDRDLTIDIDVVPATTNGFGNIEYSDKGLKNSASLPMDIKKNIEYPEQIVLKGNSTQEVIFRLHMIDEKFDGKVVSGIHFEEHDQKERIKDESTESVAINNIFAYNLALVAAQNKNVVSPELELKGSRFITESGVSNAVIEVENVGAEFANDISTELKIENISSNSTVPIETIENKKLKMAPNSIMEYRISLGDKKLKPGEYKIIGNMFYSVIENGEYNYDGKEYAKKMSVDQTVVIKKEEAEKLNSSNVKITSETTNYSGYIILLLVVFIVLLVIFGYRNIRKQKKLALSKKILSPKKKTKEKHLKNSKDMQNKRKERKGRKKSK